MKAHPIIPQKILSKLNEDGDTMHEFGVEVAQT